MADQPGFWSKWNLPPERQFRGKFTLDVTAAPEPSDIKYENLEATPGQRAILWMQSWSLKLLLLLAGFIIISIAPAIQVRGFRRSKEE